LSDIAREDGILVADHHIKCRYAYLIFISVESSVKVIMAKDSAFIPTLKEGDFPALSFAILQVKTIKYCDVDYETAKKEVMG
jgi:hypothetical protein